MPYRRLTAVLAALSISATASGCLAEATRARASIHLTRLAILSPLTPTPAEIVLSVVSVATIVFSFYVCTQMVRGRVLPVRASP